MLKVFTRNEEFTLIYQINEELIHWKIPEGLYILLAFKGL